MGFNLDDNIINSILKIGFVDSNTDKKLVENIEREGKIIYETK